MANEEEKKKEKKTTNNSNDHTENSRKNASDEKKGGKDDDKTSSYNKSKGRKNGSSDRHSKGNTGRDRSRGSDKTDRESSNKNGSEKKQDKGTEKKEWRNGVTRSGHLNDPSWYKISQSLTDAGANIPFNVFAGTTLANSFSIDERATIVGPNTVPSVFALKYLAVPGSSRSVTSAVNVASRAIYSWVRHANSGSANYEHVDLMLYILAMEQVYILINEAKRIYRTAMTYVVTNRNIPDALLRAMGVDSNSVRQNLAQFRYAINLRIAQVSALAVPKDLDVFKRHALLASIVLGDADSLRAQFYVPVLDSYYTYEATSTGGGSLVLNAKGDAATPYTEVIAYIDNCLNALLPDEDINIMSGDILKAYGSDQLYDIPELKEDETLDIVYDADLLNQIENAHICPKSTGGVQVKQSITQKAGYLVYDPRISLTPTTNVDVRMFAAYIRGNGIYFNAHREQVTADDVMEWSRFMLGGYGPDDDIQIICGTEIIVGAEIVAYVEDQSTHVLSLSSFSNIATVSIQLATGMTTVSHWLTQRCIYSIFDWAPLFFYGYSNNNIDYCSPVNGDLDKWTMVSGETVRRLNDMAVLGEFKTKELTSKTSR